MLKELLDAVTAQAVAASLPRVVSLDFEPDHVYGVCLPGQDLIRMEAKAQPRDHKAASPQAILAFATRFNEAATSDFSALWYHRSGITLILDDERRRDKIHLPLELSHQMKVLKQLEESRRLFKQPEFRRLLRIDFAGCQALCPNLLALIERVKFRVGSQTEAAVGHGKSSVGRQLESEVTGTGSLPEYVDLYVPVFASGFPSISAIIKCALEPDAGTESFQLIPLPGQIEAGIVEAESSIAKVIAEASLGEYVGIYHGTP